MSNAVRRVTLTVELASGDSHTLVADHPGPRGANPRFMSQQLTEAVTELGNRADELLDTYASQITAAV